MLFFIFYYENSNTQSNYTCNILPGYRIPCGNNITSSPRCSEANCCFDENVTFCFQTLPSKYQYTMGDGQLEFVPKMERSPFGRPNKPKIYLKYEETDKNKLSITLSDQKFPEQQNFDFGGENFDYEGTIFEEDLSVEVKRRETQEKILSTSEGPLIVSDKYWEWTLDLNTKNLFGLDQLRIPDNVTTTRIIYPNAKHHGIIPKFIAEQGGKFHGVTIRYSGPLEISVLSSKLIVIRMLSGLPVAIDLVLGPTPIEVLKQQNVEPVMPPYWALGVHICRYKFDL